MPAPALMTATATPASRDTMLSRKQVEQITGLSRSTLYARMADGSFPRRVKLSLNRVGWSEAAVRQWMATRPEVGGGLVNEAA